MIKFILLAAACGFILGTLLHKWIVKEDMLIAEKVKILVGQKLAAAKDALAKPAAAVKAEVKAEIAKVEAGVKTETVKIETKAGDGSCGIGGFPPCEEKKI